MIETLRENLGTFFVAMNSIAPVLIGVISKLSNGSSIEKIICQYYDCKTTRGQYANFQVMLR